MAKKVKYEKNVPLEPGDKVICINMSDKFSGVAGGTPGVVKSVSNVFGMNQYYVNWKIQVWAEDPNLSGLIPGAKTPI